MSIKLKRITAKLAICTAILGLFDCGSWQITCRNIERVKMSAPVLWNIDKLISPDCIICIGGKWYPARPYGYDNLFNRFKLAYMVFTGKADALIMTGQHEELSKF